jgi:hypothetical protein
MMHKARSYLQAELTVLKVIVLFLDLLLGVLIVRWKELRNRWPELTPKSIPAFCKEK